MSYGVTSLGFVRKKLADIKKDLETALKAEFGDQILLGTDSVYGKLVGCFAQPLADVWELAEAVYNAFYPGTTGGTSLGNVCDLVGIQRKDATRSQVKVVLKGVIGTVITAGSLAKTSNIGDQFKAKADTTLSATLASHAYTSLVGSVSTGKVYTITINGTSFTYTAQAGDDADAVGVALKNAINAGTQPVTASDLTGGKVLTQGDPDADGLHTLFTVTVNANVKIDEVGNQVDWEGANTGPVVAFANTLVTIVTPISGWAAIWNPLDATKGRDVELDSVLRTRRVQSLATPGAGTVEAIRAALLAITDVTACLVLENTGDATDGYGLPSKSIAAVIKGGEEEDIVAEIWARKAGGIYCHGNTLVNITDSQGFSQPIRYSRPTSKLMWVKATYSTDPEAVPGFPSNGVDLIKAALLTKGQAHSIGNDVLPAQFYGPVTQACTGIKTLTVDVKLNGGAYQSTPYAIGPTELAMFDSARIEVTT